MYGQFLPFWTPRYYGHPDNTFAFANFALPGGRAFANLRANPKLLTRTQFPIRLSIPHPYATEFLKQFLHSTSVLNQFTLFITFVLKLKDSGLQKISAQFQRHQKS